MKSLKAWHTSAPAEVVLRKKTSKHETPERKFNIFICFMILYLISVCTQRLQLTAKNLHVGLLICTLLPGFGFICSVEYFKVFYKVQVLILPSLRKPVYLLIVVTCFRA